MVEIIGAFVVGFACGALLIIYIVDKGDEV